MEIKTSSFGKNGAQLFSLINDQGLILEVSNYGARVVNLFVPEKKGKRNLILGFDSAEEYAEKDSYIGATIGRVAGRISQGQFTLDQKSYQLPKNDGENHLHGGYESFDRQLWQAEIFENTEAVSVEFSLESPALENDYPGNVTIKVRHTLTNANQWQIDYSGVTDQVTLFNPTNHVYFNLNTETNQEIGNHRLTLAAEEFIVLTDELIPTGEKRPVKDTPFDFTDPSGTVIQRGFDSQDEQTTLVDGYDHAFLLPVGETVKGQLTNSDGSIAVKLYTDAPSVVVYTSNAVVTPIPMRTSQQVYHGGITFETQGLPDAINHPDFGQIVLHPTEEFKSRTTFEIVWALEGAI